MPDKLRKKMWCVCTIFSTIKLEKCENFEIFQKKKKKIFVLELFVWKEKKLHETRDHHDKKITNVILSPFCTWKLSAKNSAAMFVWFDLIRVVVLAHCIIFRFEIGFTNYNGVPKWIQFSYHA